jgi:hypothetical protein
MASTPITRCGAPVADRAANHQESVRFARTISWQSLAITVDSQHTHPSWNAWLSPHGRATIASFMSIYVIIGVRQCRSGDKNGPVNGSVHERRPRSLASCRGELGRLNKVTCPHRSRVRRGCLVRRTWFVLNLYEHGSGVALPICRRARHVVRVHGPGMLAMWHARDRVPPGRHSWADAQALLGHTDSPASPLRNACHDEGTEGTSRARAPQAWAENDRCSGS